MQRVRLRGELTWSGQSNKDLLPTPGFSQANKYSHVVQYLSVWRCTETEIGKTVNLQILEIDSSVVRYIVL